MIDYSEAERIICALERRVDALIKMIEVTCGKASDSDSGRTLRTPRRFDESGL